MQIICMKLKGLGKVAISNVQIFASYIAFEIEAQLPPFACNDLG